MKKIIIVYIIVMAILGFFHREVESIFGIGDREITIFAIIFAIVLLIIKVFTGNSGISRNHRQINRDNLLAGKICGNCLNLGDDDCTWPPGQRSKPAHIQTCFNWRG